MALKTDFADWTKIIFLLTTCFGLISTTVIPLDASNFEHTIEPAQIAVVNFYADWCRFSQLLKPVFEETSQAFENQTNVIFGSVDCDRKPELAKKYNINKFPTLKYFRFGQLSKREYRGARSIEAMTSFVKNNLQPVFTHIASPAELESKVETTKRSLFVFLNSAENTPEMHNLQKIGANLREDCKFYLGVGLDFQDQLKNGNSVVFRPPDSSKTDEISLSGAMLQDYEYLRQWITDKCIPLVRDLTFENAEELTEEGLPFLILFRKSDDHAILETFTQQVAAQLNDQKAYINVLVADGVKFAHPLHHLGKSAADLPLIAIDSFTHMYLFPDIRKLIEPNALKQFVFDLYSGKLHREFHNGPDPAIAANPQDQQPASSDPPSSIFQKLKPSQNRYTILRDEL